MLQSNLYHSTAKCVKYARTVEIHKIMRCAHVCSHVHVQSTRTHPCNVHMCTCETQNHEIMLRAWTCAYEASMCMTYPRVHCLRTIMHFSPRVHAHLDAQGARKCKPSDHTGMRNTHAYVKRKPWSPGSTYVCYICAMWYLAHTYNTHASGKGVYVRMHPGRRSRHAFMQKHPKNHESYFLYNRAQKTWFMYLYPTGWTPYSHRRLACTQGSNNTGENAE